MPNKQYRSERNFEESWPQDWNDLDEKTKECIEQKFLLEQVCEREHMRALRQFNESNWRQLNGNQRKELCQRLEDCLAFDSGREPYTIEPEEETVQYKEKTTFIDINKSSYESLQAVVYASCHADVLDIFNKKGAVSRGIGDFDDYKKELKQKSLTEMDVLVMRWELQNYLTVDDSLGQTERKNLHKMQLFEIDANFQSTKYLRDNCEIIGTDSDFSKYLESKENDMSELQDLFKKEETVKAWFKDRMDRLNDSNVAGFSTFEQLRLRNIYREGNFNRFQLLTIKNLKEWDCKQSKECVKIVTLDQLLDKDVTKEDNARHASETSTTKAKRMKLNL